MSDDYEASIATPGEVLHRDKLVSRPLAVICLLMTLLAFAGAAGGLAQGAPLAAGLGVGAAGLLFLFLGLTRSVLRTVLTANDLRIQWGLWGPRIALSNVKGVRVRGDYTRKALIEAMREPGSPGIEMFAIPHRGEILDLEWTDESGRARRAWLGAQDPAALCDAIQRAVAGATGGRRVADVAYAPTGLRVAGATDATNAAGEPGAEEEFPAAEEAVPEAPAQKAR